MPTYAKAGRYAENLLDTAGDPLANTAVTVRLPGTSTPATLYTDRSKGTTASNPVSSDAYGNLGFFADPGYYDLFVNSVTVPNVLVPVDTEIPAPDATYVRVSDERLSAKDSRVSPALVGDGTADDSAALAAWMTLLGTGGSGAQGYLPDGVYSHDGTLATPAVDDIGLEFGADAWLAPTTGHGLKVDDFGRHRLVGVKVRLNAGSTATRGIWVLSAQRTSLYDPTVWSFINIPAGFTAIDVDDNSFWCNLYTPRVRKNSGSLTGTFATGIRFRNQSNAGRVWGGNVSHCDDAVLVDGSGNVEAIGVSFEDCTDGVDIINPTGAGSNGGAVVTLCRGESLTNLVNITQTVALPNPIQPFQVGGNVPVSSVTRILNNPNDQPIMGLARPITDYPTHVQVNYLTEPVAHTNWAGTTQSSTRYLAGDRNSTGSAAGDSISYDVVLSKGVWTMHLVHVRGADGGIYSFTVDGSTFGTTVDGYAAATAAARDGVQSFNVDVSGTKRVTLTINSKNASSSGFKGRISAISFTRTADRSPLG